VASVPWSAPQFIRFCLSVHVNSNAFFTLRNQPHLRGHKYVIAKQRSVNRIRIRESLFSNRAVYLYNLPVCTDFTTIGKYSSSLNNDYLLKYSNAPNFT